MWKLVIECTTKLEINGEEYDHTNRIEYKISDFEDIEVLIGRNQSSGTGKFKYIVEFEKEGE